MRDVKDCITAFLPLLNTEYEIVLGRKGVAVSLRILFDKKDCFHLMGLQYLLDRPELNRNRSRVFDEIVAGSITTEQIESSDFYMKIKERVHFLPLLEQMLDSNDTVFKYSQRANIYSMIEADYLMKNNMEEICIFFYPMERMIGISADLFSQRIKGIIQETRLRGRCYIKRNIIGLPVRESFCMTGLSDE